MCIRVFLIVSAILGALNTSDAQTAEWQLVWTDTFDRSEIGRDWHLVKGEARLKDGKLFLKGAGATIVTTLSFKPDVRIEFDALADPSVPPCDLSATIGASEEFGYGYLFAFG
ncbi:MAG: hypothetical protein QHI38_06750, partial [Armatimonadota bacterium]|nr:hypothetical protein [Armatimonadota bacterium]